MTAKVREAFAKYGFEVQTAFIGLELTSTIFCSIRSLSSEKTHRSGAG
jgi:hypothetical protein